MLARTNQKIVMVLWCALAAVALAACGGGPSEADIDATVVTRILDEGGEILGKSVCEYFSVSGGSATSASSVVESPRNPGHTSGGSSTGSAARAQESCWTTGWKRWESTRIPSRATTGS